MAQSLTLEAPLAAATGMPAAAAGERRILALDGLRGMMTIFVLVAHFFGEPQHGIRGAMLGWIAVDVFFVLSGFLIGRQLLASRDRPRSVSAYYVRRFFRLMPLYILVVLGVGAIAIGIGRLWAEAEALHPLWSYLTLSQTAFIALRESGGARWLEPTWTLAVETHFYILAPLLLVRLPQPRLLPALFGLAAAAVAFRIAVFALDAGPHLLALTSLPGRLDLFLAGILAAAIHRRPDIPWQRLLFGLRLAPLLSLLALIALKLWSDPAFAVLNPLVLGVGTACLILALLQGAPEARTFQSRVLRFFAQNSYAIYLTHLPVLGLAHGLMLAAKPDLETPAQWLVTLASVPAAILVGWLLTRLVEEPFTRYGKSLRWGEAQRA